MADLTESQLDVHYPRIYREMRDDELWKHGYENGHSRAAILNEQIRRKRNVYEECICETLGPGSDEAAQFTRPVYPNDHLPR